jgi:hypothetical protein
MKEHQGTDADRQTSFPYLTKLTRDKKLVSSTGEVWAAEAPERKHQLRNASGKEQSIRTDYSLKSAPFFSSSKRIPRCDRQVRNLLRIVTCLTLHSADWYSIFP